MTDTDRITSDETHGSELANQLAATGIDREQAQTVAEQIEQAQSVEAAAEALEVLDGAGELNDEAAELADELEAALGTSEPLEATREEIAGWEQTVIEGLETSERYADEGRFFARIANQLVDIRNATRIAQVINANYPSFLADQRAKGAAAVEVEALFDRARAGANAVFSLLSVTIRLLEQCDPPGIRSPTPTTTTPPGAAVVAAAPRRRIQAPANRPAAPRPAPGPGPVPPHLRGDPPPTEIPEPAVDPVRQRVIDAQRAAERRRAEQASRGTTEPRGRVAPQNVAPVHRRKPSGPVSQRAITVERDSRTSLIQASRQLLEDLRRRNRPVERERITRFCKSLARLGEQGQISERLATFALHVEKHQNPKNVAKLAAFFLAELKNPPQQ